jgi:hypothetical protein
MTQAFPVFPLPPCACRARRLRRWPAIGLIWGALVASLPDIKARIGAGDAELGVAILSSSVSAFVAMAIAPWIAARVRADVLVPVMASSWRSARCRWAS